MKHFAAGLIVVSASPGDREDRNPPLAEIKATEEEEKATTDKKHSSSKQEE